MRDVAHDQRAIERRAAGREERAPGGVVEQRAGVARRDEAALALAVVPRDGDAVRRVLAGDATHAREPLRANVLEANETDPRHGLPVVQLRPEARREQAL